MKAGTGRRTRGGGRLGRNRRGLVASSSSSSSCLGCSSWEWEWEWDGVGISNWNAGNGMELEGGGVWIFKRGGVRGGGGGPGFTWVEAGGWGQETRGCHVEGVCLCVAVATSFPFCLRIVFFFTPFASGLVKWIFLLIFLQFFIFSMSIGDICQYNFPLEKPFCYFLLLNTKLLVPFEVLV